MSRGRHLTVVRDEAAERARLEAMVRAFALYVGAWCLRVGDDAVGWIATQRATLPNGRTHTDYDATAGAIPFTEAAALMTARAPDVAERLTDPLPHGERWCMVLTEHAAALVTFKVPRRSHAIARSSKNPELEAAVREALARAHAKARESLDAEAADPKPRTGFLDADTRMMRFGAKREQERGVRGWLTIALEDHERGVLRLFVRTELLATYERIFGDEAYARAIFEKAAHITPRPTLQEVEGAIHDLWPLPSHHELTEEERDAAQLFTEFITHESHLGYGFITRSLAPPRPTQERVIRHLEERAAAERERDRIAREHRARIEAQRVEHEQQERAREEREAAALRERRNEAPERCASCLRGRLEAMTIHDLAAAAVAALDTVDGQAIERRALALTDTVVAIVCDLSHGAAPLPSWFRTELSHELPYTQRDVVVDVRVTLRAHVALVRPPQAAALAAGADLDPGVFREALALLDAPGPDHTARVAVFYEGRWTVVQSPHTHTPRAVHNARRGVVRVEFARRERERLLSAVRAAVHRGVMPELIAAEDLGAEFLCNATEDRVQVMLNAAAPPWRDPAARALLDATGRALARFPMGYHETAHAFAALTRAYLAPATVRDLAELARACAFVLDVLTHDTSTGGLAAAADLARVIRDLYAFAHATAAQEHPEGPGSVTLNTPLRA